MGDPATELQSDRACRQASDGELATVSLQELSLWIASTSRAPVIWTAVLDFTRSPVFPERRRIWDDPRPMTARIPIAMTLSIRLKPDSFFKIRRISMIHPR